ncbi:TetR/AcrR family transcriptional regulator [Saccharothrix lopnurensis]|uniref:TetR/AcrR family transcriptional regulator n=1 Tax=Saccharothrix lopnurensis TaxID=1670621 RepID=A0ABW1P7X7_9PSEU
MARDAEATRRRLLTAAADEFAAHGIAGARVDRIATAAGSSKAQIYHYFGSKERLFDAVLVGVVSRAVTEVPIDVDDLPAYAGRLFDHYEDDPRIARLAIWCSVERAVRAERLDALSTAVEDELSLIRRAQATGSLTSTRQAVDLLNLVLHMSLLWALVLPELEDRISRTSRAHRRQVITDAVATMLVPT